MEIKVKHLLVAAILYMYIPIAVFLIGWLHISYAIPALLILTAGVTFGLWELLLQEVRVIRISKTMLCTGAVIIFFLCWQTGIGAFTGQAGDWHKHNAVLHDLIERPWPVVYTTDYGSSMLSYYIGQSILPAVIGKISGSFRLAEITQFLLSATGLFIIWLFLTVLCDIHGSKKQVSALLLLFFFSGMLVLGQVIAGNLYPDNFPYGSYEWMNPETIRIQYTSNWSLLKWVPGQTIVPWMATAILLLHPKQIKSYVMIGLAVIMYSSFAMVGLAAMMSFMAVYYSITVFKKKTLSNIFSISNLTLTLVIGSICILYFWGNLAGIKPDNMSFHFLNYGKKVFFYFIFIFFSFGGYALLILKEHRRNIIYWSTVIPLCIYPLFSMGVYNDFTMRTSIPALFTLMVLLLNSLMLKPADSRAECGHLRGTILTVGLLIGMIYPLLSVRESIVKNKWGEIKRSDSYLSLEQFADPSNPEVPDDFKYNYYSYDLEKDIFYKYLAK